MEGAARALRTEESISRLAVHDAVYFGLDWSGNNMRIFLCEGIAWLSGLPTGQLRRPCNVYRAVLRVAWFKQPKVPHRAGTLFFLSIIGNRSLLHGSPFPKKYATSFYLMKSSGSISWKWKLVGTCQRKSPVTLSGTRRIFIIQQFLLIATPSEPSALSGPFDPLPIP
jgi:hypothetical protein